MIRKQSAVQRDGVILLVVISLLVLFSLVGLAFVVYAEGQANVARLWREAETAQRPDMDQELLLAYFLSQLIYDTDNPHSALRGHSFARTMYGRPGGTVAFNGTGRLHNGNPDSFLNINYTQFGAPVNFENYGSPNPPWTYPDLNNVFLAAVRASDGSVLIPSYHRPGFGDPANRRQVLRPLPTDHAGFPAMEDEGGDVKNLADSPGYLIPGSNPPRYARNDSVWIDLGFPVMTGPDGRRFKPLFAPLIQDLDNRVNVNVHGNMISPLGDAGGSLNGGLDVANGRHSSHQGWGPWEVNLQKVLTATEPPVNPPAGYQNQVNYEARKIFTGDLATGTRGRYDPEFWGLGGAKNQVLDAYMVKGRSYSLTNSEGDSGDQNATPYRVRHDRLFPELTGYGFENGDSASGARNHQAAFATLTPTRTALVPNNPLRDDRTFPASTMEPLLRYGDMGSPGMTTDLFLLLPNSLNVPKARRLITTHAFDLATPGVLPGVSGGGYRLPAGSPTPTANPVMFPAAGTPPAGSEFANDWTSAAAALGRLDLNRILPNYPAPAGANVAISTAAELTSFRKAQEARQFLAKSIFDVLRQVTGATDPAIAAGEELEACRWLAQLAVNIVDYTDKDDYLTPFEWKQGEFVFGNELPRLVINEAYVEIGNATADATANMASQPFQVRFWVELHSPISALTESDKVRLKRPNSSPDDSCYKIVIVKEPTRLDAPDNPRGEPDPNNGNVVLDFRDYTTEPGFTPLAGIDVNVVRPLDSTSGPDQSNQGYYVVGPADDFPGTDAARPRATLKVQKNDSLNPPSGLVYTVPNSTAVNQFPARHTLLLRRLACPHLPHQPNPAGSATPYNPYVTVDYLKDVPVNDAVRVTNSGMRQNAPPTVNDVAQRFATGRKQPYAAALPYDQKPTTALTGQPQHTLFKRNLPTPTTTVNSYQWLAFMDRPLVSPIELLQVPITSPSQLTQRFIQDDGAGGQRLFGHFAPWFDQNNRIYRLMEFLQAGTFVQNTGPGTRSVGKINLNTIWDVETWQALCDQQGINRFVAADVTNTFQRMTSWRTPGGQPRPGDQPFTGWAPPPFATNDSQFPGVGIDRTFLAGDPADANPDPLRRRRMFEHAVPATAMNHPYLRYELMNKISSHLTTRSNVFAVWLTVGYFEVMDDSDPTRPPRLGQEVGRAEMRHVRHRMFAVIDRTNLTLDPMNPTRPGARPYFLNATGAADAGTNVITVGIAQGKYEDHTLAIRVGDRIVVDSGPYREVVNVTAVGNAANGLYSLTVNPAFTRRHELGVPITSAGASTILGNPGPQPRFDPRDPVYRGIVRHFSIIE